jgi:hypothetical protein
MAGVVHPVVGDQISAAAAELVVAAMHLRQPHPPSGLNLGVGGRRLCRSGLLLGLAGCFSVSSKGNQDREAVDQRRTAAGERERKA